jgi:hypothetical protein
LWEVNVEVKLAADCTCQLSSQWKYQKRNEEEAFDFVRCSKIQTQNQLQIEL